MNINIWLKCSENRAPEQLLVLVKWESIIETAKCFHNPDQPDDWYNSSGFRIFPDYWTPMDHIIKKGE